MNRRSFFGAFCGLLGAVPLLHKIKIASDDENSALQPIETIARGVRGQSAPIINVANIVTCYEYDAAGQLQTRDRLYAYYGKSTTYTYGPNGNPG